MMKCSAALLSASTAVRSAVDSLVQRPFSRALAVLGVSALVLAGCNAVTTSGDGGGGDGINDAALGVAASPLVSDQETNLPRGGGRAQVGRPYRIAGRLYTPREDPTYDRTGIASWYGPGFHGRLTANGEVFDQSALSAAHPTLPLPSYVRVTNLENRHSVVVRVNDRGPFAHDRIIDLSQRAADVLAFRGDGVARVRVEYEGRAPLHGQDVAWMESTIQINGQPVNGSDSGVMLARAPVLAPTPAAPPNQIAFASSDQSSAVEQAAPQRASFLDSLFGQPRNEPQTQTAPVLVQPSAPATGSPLVLAPPSGAQATAPSVFPAPATQPAGGLVPNAPIPSAAIGFMATDLEAGFTQRNQSALAQTARIELAHQAASANALDAASAMALQSQAVARLSATQQTQILAVVPTPDLPATGRTALIQIGIFGDPANVTRLRSELASFGEVVTEPVQSRGRALTQVRLRAAAATQSAEEELLRRLASQGYTDAYVTDASDS